jgi:hypothetical protein
MEDPHQLVDYFEDMLLEDGIFSNMVFTLVPDQSMKYVSLHVVLEDPKVGIINSLTDLDSSNPLSDIPPRSHRALSTSPSCAS